MKLRSLALLAALVAAPVFAQKEPAEVTDAEIAKYKAAAASSCQDAGIKKGDPKEKVDAFCGCLMSTIGTTMTRAEWQQAYFYSMKGQSKEERQVLDPHLKNVGSCVPKPAPAEAAKSDAQKDAPKSDAPAGKAKPNPSQGLRPPASK